MSEPSVKLKEYTLSELVLRGEKIRELNGFCAPSRQNNHFNPYDPTIDDMIDAWIHRNKIKCNGRIYEYISSIKLTKDKYDNCILQVELYGNNQNRGYLVIACPKDIEILEQE